jgi:hypothetical protein
MNAFVPASSDVPSYLLPMMNDSDRNFAYEKAIKETIEKFIIEQKRAPLVLDLGAGAGLLSLICLQYGAAHVTLLEANTTLAMLASEQLKTSSYPASKWKVVSCMSTQFNLSSSTNQPPFDMVVCELIGSMLHSESMGIYLWDVLNRGIVRTFPNPATLSLSSDYIHYMVPKSGVMTARIYQAPHATGLITGLQYAPMNTIYEAVYDTRRISSKADWNLDESMKFCLASGPFKPLSSAISILEEKYDILDNPIAYAQEIQFQLAEKIPSDAVVVLEWKVQLSDQSILYHTLDHVASMHPQVRLARWINWGFTFAPLHHFVDDISLSNGTCNISITWHPADLEFISKRTFSLSSSSNNEPSTNSINTMVHVPIKSLNKVLLVTRKMVKDGKSSV